MRHPRLALIGRRRIGLFITALAIGAVAVATLRPDWSQVDTVWRRCLTCGDRPVADALTNLLLFVPFGVGLALAAVRASRVWLSGALLSCLVELIQLALPGRDPSVGDVLFNTLGTVAGAVAAWKFSWWQRAATANGGLVAASGFCVVVLATGWLLGPSLPRTEYWGQWTPYREQFAWYRGRVLRSDVGPLAVRSYRISDSRAARAAIAEGQPITVEAIAGPPVSRLAILFAIVDADSREIALLGLDRTDLVFRHRTRAAGYGLDQPHIRLRDAVRRVRAGESLRVRVWQEGPVGWCISVNDRMGCGLGYSAGNGWALLYYHQSLPRWLRDLLDALWLAVLLMPLGLALRPSGRSALALGLALGVLAAGSRGVGLLSPDLLEWAGSASGLAAGLLLGRLAGRPG